LWIVKTVGSERTPDQTHAVCAAAKAPEPTASRGNGRHRAARSAHEFDGYAREFGKTLGVVRIVAALISVQVLAIKEKGIVHEKIPDARMGPAFDNSRKAQRIADGDADA